MGVPYRARGAQKWVSRIVGGNQKVGVPDCVHRAQKWVSRIAPRRLQAGASAPRCAGGTPRTHKWVSHIVPYCAHIVPLEHKSGCPGLCRNRRVGVPYRPVERKSGCPVLPSPRIHGRDQTVGTEKWVSRIGRNRRVGVPYRPVERKSGCPVLPSPRIHGRDQTVGTEKWVSRIGGGEEEIPAFQTGQEIRRGNGTLAVTPWRGLIAATHDTGHPASVESPKRWA
ncbi:MAG: hypothetical protein KatS3mg077_1567 [Candidatus Binatia bacterium]|nr:MAG: hypothetical protein KatS3mg077_1567 [Candidatus Binatia bacterium]